MCGFQIFVGFGFGFGFDKKSVFGFGFGFGFQNYVDIPELSESPWPGLDIF